MADDRLPPKEGAHLYRVQNKPSVMEQSLWWQEDPATSTCWWTCREGHFWVNKRVVLIYHTQLFWLYKCKKEENQCENCDLLPKVTHTYSNFIRRNQWRQRDLHKGGYSIQSLRNQPGSGVRPQMAWKCFPNEVLQGCHVKKEIWQD